MAGTKLKVNGTICFVDYHDGEGEAIVNGRTWRWTFHEYCGPFFIKKDGSDLKRQPGENHPVWKFLEAWFKKYKVARKKAKRSEIVRI